MCANNLDVFIFIIRRQGRGIGSINNIFKNKFLFIILISLLVKHCSIVKKFISNTHVTYFIILVNIEIILWSIAIRGGFALQSTCFIKC